MQKSLPRIEISLSKIQENARILCALYGQRGIGLMGVTKAVLGEPAIAEAMILGGVRYIADSRIENIIKMKAADKFSTQFVLLRSPPSHAEIIIKHADISLNSEMETIRELSLFAKGNDKSHKVIIMVELGDLREGILPADLSQFVKETLSLPHIYIIGIGCNLACHGGIKPGNKNMEKLSDLAGSLEKEFHIKLEIISGGNSANYDWFKSTKSMGRINNLRIGESILLGRETIGRKQIPGLHTGAFKLVTEVIESKKKPSLPFGDNGQDAFGDNPSFSDRGIRERTIVALGKQDVHMQGLTPESPLTILGASSDHTIIDNENHNFKVGDEVSFGLKYSGLLSAMTSPFINKRFVKDCDQEPVHSSPALPARARLNTNAETELK
ncbi:MAG: alanine/ornithine racemase family PLP-dependent enzyme [Candidatus Nitrohelix vancouverensis]|uniref:Alanine/ornithine racemase family PLP-dependent enzyme n=1 Tax=Candidatus Nitrohelix vancouverensis TaxID=2705534 RepID=A0A7T0G3H4_9BACT|nr:MAG: alanine/ornithine racemase family PLP-dependent enzyme [Candidatus Nitrohelix vancouverensis]